MSKRKLASTDIDMDGSAEKRARDCCSNIRISATKTRNYLMNDPLIDWLDMYGADAGFTKKSQDYLKILFKEGNEFEQRIMEEIYKRFPGQCIEIKNGSSKQKIYKTRMAISNGIPMIYQGAVENSKINSWGLPDLIVRVDFLNTLMNEEIVSPTVLENDLVYASSYCIIDIKHSTIYLSNDRTIRNSARIMPYKGQVTIYSEALAELQNGYTPPYAYILGKRTVISKESFEPFDYLGVVDLRGKDALVVDATHRAVRWRQELQCHGREWDAWVPGRWEMAPNMCNLNKGWEDVKYRLAYHQGEITLLWKARFNERNQLWTEGIRSWRNRRFCPQLLKAAKSNVQYKALLDQALEVNRTDYKSFLPIRIDRDRPIKSFPNWRSEGLEFYIDFETASNYIFLIGMGYENEGGQWTFEYFVADTLDENGEAQVVRNWLIRLKLLRNRQSIRLIHWTYAERNNYSNALRRHNIRDIKAEWIDLHKFFLEIPISVRGSFTYGLKDVACSLHSTGNIQTVWADSSMSGLTAMILAKEAEARRVSRLIDVPIMSTIVNYNEIDCKVLWEILLFVRDKL